MSAIVSPGVLDGVGAQGLSGLPAAARSVLALLRHLRSDRLELVLPDGRAVHYGEHLVGERPPVQLRVLDWRVFGHTLRRGDVGFAEGYFEGRWTTSDLPRLLRLLLVNREALQRTLYGSAWGTFVLRLRHMLRANSRRGSRHNIHAHYDIGNTFYELWLDPGMNYSSALFEPSGLSLEQAQQRKIDRVLRQLDVQPGARVLEIGCGWGAFAQTAAQRGLQLDGVTLSREQLQWGRERLRAAGADQLARLHLLDYRDLPRITPAGGFDAVASIEMFEAVGERYWKGFFRMLAGSLRPGGRACVQSITIDEALFDHYRRNTDFIQQYIFPGGMLPSREVFRCLAVAAGLEVVDEFAFGRDYATTLGLWRRRFAQVTEQLQAQGFDRRFRLLWDFYLAYCEAGFAQGSTDVVQFTLQKREGR